MSRYLPLIFTRHAKQMLAERVIETAWVELTIREPEGVEPDPVRPGVTLAFRRIPERGTRFLRVAYVEETQAIRIVTVFFDFDLRKGARAPP